MTFSSFKSAIPWSFDSDSESETLKAEISRPNPSPIPSLQPRVSEFRVRDERLGKFWCVYLLKGPKGLLEIIFYLIGILGSLILDINNFCYADLG